MLEAACFEFHLEHFTELAGVKAENSKVRGLPFLGYSLPEVDRIWLWVHYIKIPIYTIFYLLKGDYRLGGLVV